MAIRDNYEKTIIALECDFTRSYEGINIVNLLDFLLESLSIT